MSHCSDRGYVLGDLFEVICSANMEEFLTKGMILKLVRDDYSKQPEFEYVSGEPTQYVYNGQTVWVSIYDLKKINTVEVQPADKVSQQETYTKQDIEEAFNNLNWEESFEGFMIALDVVSNPEYKEYLRLKAKHEKTAV